MTADGDRFVLFGRPAIDETAIEEVAATLRSGWIGAGPKVNRLQEEVAALVGVPFAVAVNSCTAGLEVALRVAGIQPGDEVITSALTFVATANAIVHAGALPVLADVDPLTRAIDPAAIEKAITPRTRAIMPVHLAGLPCDMDEIQAIANRHGLLVVEDAAHALGATVGDRSIGSHSDLAVFSFGPPKQVTTGEGGLITTSNPEWAAAAEAFCGQGLSTSAWARQARGNLGAALAVTAGRNYRMTDISASLGLAALRRFAEDSQRRTEIWQRYDEAFAALPLELPPAAPPGAVHAQALYSPIVDVEELGNNRDWVRIQLRERGVGTGVHYVPFHLHPYYRQLLELGPGDFPNADYIGERTFSLPMSAQLSDDDVEHVISAVRSVFSPQP